MVTGTQAGAEVDHGNSLFKPDCKNKGTLYSCETIEPQQRGVDVNNCKSTKETNIYVNVNDRMKASTERAMNNNGRQSPSHSTPTNTLNPSLDTRGVQYIPFVWAHSIQWPDGEQWFRRYPCMENRSNVKKNSRSFVLGRKKKKKSD